jgi:hypothetical protein
MYQSLLWDFHHSKSDGASHFIAKVHVQPSCPQMLSLHVNSRFGDLAQLTRVEKLNGVPTD